MGLSFLGLFNGCLIENVPKRVEDVMPIATGHEREELEAALQVSFLLSLICYLYSLCRVE